MMIAFDLGEFMMAHGYAPDDIETRDVKRCVACGEDHPILFVPLFGKPRYIDGDQYSHWGVCKVTGDPVFMRRTNRQDA